MVHRKPEQPAPESNGMYRLIADLDDEKTEWFTMVSGKISVPEMDAAPGLREEGFLPIRFWIDIVRRRPRAFEPQQDSWVRGSPPNPSIGDISPHDGVFHPRI